MGAIASAALVLLRPGVPHFGAGSTTASAMAATPASATSALLSATTPVPVLSMATAAPASAATVASAIRSVQAETRRQLLSGASTMDLMMPIDEPDLDITSRHSLWSQVGKAAGVDPLLLYSVALVESKALYPDGKVAPTPWLFRVNDHLVRGERHDVQLAMAAASQFGSAVQDVGIMQVYYPMHRDAVRDPLTLLNPRTNITVAAKILRDGMHQTRDRVLGVGYYHSHTPSLARDYGTAVLTVYQRLQAIHRPAHGGQAVAR
ncbi:MULTISPECIES: transglycosylase SLT domain-containing protein [Rhodanobacter]|uniref:transglycosylase SLT domain-containing protein n=1 Tax=Rhodanobacter TaxID=75309 RepID=UPI001F25C80D|nr:MULTISPECIES: transglycosylase SLT domain-containing protein [Rhodanobacter]